MARGTDWGDVSLRVVDEVVQDQRGAAEACDPQDTAFTFRRIDSNDPARMPCYVQAGIAHLIRRQHIVVNIGKLHVVQVTYLAAVDRDQVCAVPAYVGSATLEVHAVAGSDVDLTLGYIGMVDLIGE